MAAYTIEITKAVVSLYTGEPCPDGCAAPGFEDTPWQCEHTALDGDSRGIEAPYTSTETADEWDIEFHGSVVAWAIDRIRKTDATECSIHPVPSEMPDRTWMSGSYVRADGTEERTTVRLTGAWTPDQRARVFAATSYC